MSATATPMRDRFVAAMGHAAATVNVVTTDGPEGRMGVTVSAMSSVSADGERPTLLVCIHSLSPAAKAAIGNGVFCVNVLRDDQSYISDTFAGRFKEQVSDKFACAEWVAMATGSPRVADPLVAFDCRVVSSDRIGTHHVLFGEVVDIHAGSRGSPLIYANRSYGTPTRIDAAANIGAGQTAGERRIAIGCFHTFGPYLLPRIIRRLVETVPGIEIRLVEGDQRRVQESLLAGEADVALLYDIELAEGIERRFLTTIGTYVLLPEGHPLAGHASIRPADLADLSMILLEAPPSRDYFCHVMRAAGIEPRVALRSRSFETVRGLVGHGLGYALLATKPASAMTYDGRALVARPLETEVAPSRVVLAMRKSARLSGAAATFAAIAEGMFNDPA